MIGKPEAFRKGSGAAAYFHASFAHKSPRLKEVHEISLCERFDSRQSRVLFNMLQPTHPHKSRRNTWRGTNELNGGLCICSQGPELFAQVFRQTARDSTLKNRSTCYHGDAKGRGGFDNGNLRIAYCLVSQGKGFRHGKIVR